MQKAFAVTGFEGYWPVGTAAIVVAPTKERAIALLLFELKEMKLGEDNPEHWKFEEITLESPSVKILCDGNY